MYAALRYQAHLGDLRQEELGDKWQVCLGLRCSKERDSVYEDRHWMSSISMKERKSHVQTLSILMG